MRNAGGELVTPNVGGNRPAALTATENQSMNRRVRLTVRLGGADGSFSFELDYFRITGMRGVSRHASAQKVWRYVPSLSVIGYHCDGFFVVASEHAFDSRAAIGLKGDPITDPEFEHLSVSAHVTDKTEALDDAIVQINQLDFR